MDKKLDNREEVRYIASSLRKLDKLGDLLEKWLPSQAVADDIFRETLTEYQDTLTEVYSQLDRIERAIIELSNPETDNSQVTGKLRKEMYLARIESLKRQLKKLYNGKNILDEQVAEYGGRPPVELLTQTIEINEDIRKIESELSHYRGLLDD